MEQRNQSDACDENKEREKKYSNAEGSKDAGSSVQGRSGCRRGTARLQYQRGFVGNLAGMSLGSIKIH